MSDLAILSILREAMRLGASDVHIAAGTQAMMRVQGDLLAVPGVPVFDGDSYIAMISQLLTEPQKEYLQKVWSVNATFGLDTVRYRMNVAYQRQGIEAVFRVIPNHIPTPEELRLPPAIVKLAEMDRGLILVTGPTGSGKSTTLACRPECINHTRQDKAITIQDPLEFLNTNKHSAFTHRAGGHQTPQV